MAETLTELVARISTDATQLKQGLSEGEKATEASSKRMADSLKKVGVAMAASGAAITAALGLMGKAAIDEEINIQRLATTMKNAGTAYDDVKDSLEAVIATTQRKTGIADDEQRDILGRLILITQDYGKALELLPTVLDLAAVGEMDASTAATYLGKAYLDLQEGAKEVTVRFGQASLQFKSMEDIQNRVAGAAENLANPLSVLTASIGDVAEAIGANLIPLVKDAVNKIVNITIKIQDWVKEHPALAKVLTIVALAIGVILTALGGLILIMPGLIATVIAFGFVLHAALGPIGLVSLAIAGIIAVIGLVIANWSKLTNIYKSDAEKQQQILEDLANKQKAILKKQMANDKAYFAQKRQLAETNYNENIQKLREEYGIYESAQKNKMDLARDASAATRKALADELNQARKVHDVKISMLEDEYNEKIRTLNAEADYQIKAIQNQIDAIDAQTKAEDDANRIAFLQFQVSQAKTANERIAAQRELDNELILQQRESQKDSLRSQIDAIRQSTQTEEEKLQKKLEKDIETANTEFTLLETNIQLKDDALDGALERELRRLNDERIAKEKLEADSLNATLYRLGVEEIAKQKSHEAEIARINQMTNIGGRTSAIKPGILTQQSIDILSGRGIQGFDAGGIVTQPTLAMIGESGAEAVIPLSEMDKTIQNNIYMDGALLAQIVSRYFDREYRAQLT